MLTRLLQLCDTCIDALCYQRSSCVPVASFLGRWLLALLFEDLTPQSAVDCFKACRLLLALKYQAALVLQLLTGGSRCLLHGCRGALCCDLMSRFLLTHSAL